MMKPSELNIIYSGDCLDYLRDNLRLPDESVDLIITSPPYADRRRSSYGGIHPGKYVEWFLPISEQLFRVLKPTGSFILNIKENVRNGERETYVIELILALRKQGWLWTEEYCWYKKNSYPGKWPNRFRDSWERCLHFTKQKKFKMYQDAVKIPIGEWAKQRFKSMTEKDFVRHISQTNSKFGRNVSNWLNRRKVYPHNVLVFEKEHCVEPNTVIHFATECSNRNHSAAFPIELPSWFIKLFTKKNDVVLDPFMGVGTTAIAATLLERSYIGIESLFEYVEEARRNIGELEIDSQQQKLEF
jgi:site-specific DNA-methyltransferase (adenine-specific)/site-specific DNA-methyltransferase (cytosine-N4-specific)